MASTEGSPGYRTIENVIETEIRLQLQAHCGDIELLGVSDDGTVRIRLIGQCVVCPASHLTLENLIEARYRPTSSMVFQTLQEEFRQAHYMQHARGFFLKRTIAPVTGANDLVQVQFRSLFHDVGR